MERGDTVFDREFDGNRQQVLLRPLRAETGELIGAFEMTSPLSFVEDEIARTRTRFLLNTATLVVALTVFYGWCAGRSAISRTPLDFSESKNSVNVFDRRRR